MLQGVFFALEGPWEAFNLLAVCLAVATLFFSFKSVKKYNSLFIWLIQLFCYQLICFVINLFSTQILFSFRLLQVGITVSYLAIAMVSLLAVLRILSLRKAFILSSSFAVVFFIIEFTLNFQHPHLNKNHTTFTGAEWLGRKKSHKVLGSHYSPYSVLKTCYPDNPRGYFEEEDIEESEWQLLVNSGNEANLVFPSGDSEIMRIDIKKVRNINPWAFILRRKPFPLKNYNVYELTFKARADKPRNISVICHQFNEPWNMLGLYKNIELTPDWQSFNARFAANADEDNSTTPFIFMDSNIPVELSNISLYNESNHSIVKPELSLIKRFLVSYKFNSLGCRGRDYTIPKKSDTVRITVLGNSFTLGTGVHEHDTFANQLERLLNNGVKPAKSRKVYEVINCGVSGYSSREERLFYELFASKYKSDIVLIVMVLDAELSSLDKINTYNSGNRESLFYLWSCIQKDRHDNFLPDYSESLQEILQLNNEVQKHGANLAVVFFRTVPDNSTLNKSAYYKSWMDFINRISIGLKGTNIPLLDLGKSIFKNHSEQDLLVHKVIDWHPNEIAHGIAAREIMDFLKREGLFK